MKTIQTALLISSLCCALGAFFQNTPAFGIGTKWTYEARRYPVVGSITYEIVRDTVIQDTLAFEIASYGFSFGDGGVNYMYVQGDSIYFWDWALSAFKLNFDFSATQSYSTTWESWSFGGGPFEATIIVDSIREETINNTVVNVQYLHAEGEAVVESFPAKIYLGIGNAYRLKYGLGEDADVFWSTTTLRCFESDGVSYNFAGIPCDSVWVMTATTDAQLSPPVSVYPNPSRGQVFVSGLPVGPVRYTLYDIAGRRQEEGELQQGQLYIGVPGVYYLVLDVSGSLSTHKVVVTN